MNFGKWFGRSEKFGLKVAERSHRFLINAIVGGIGLQLVIYGYQYNEFFKQERVTGQYLSWGFGRRRDGPVM